MSDEIRSCVPRRVYVQAAFCDACPYQAPFIACPHLSPAVRPRSFCLERCAENLEGKCKKAGLAPVERVWEQDKRTRLPIVTPGCAYPTQIKLVGTFRDATEAERIEV